MPAPFDLSADAPPAVESLDEARALIDALWATARDLRARLEAGDAPLTLDAFDDLLGSTDAAMVVKGLEQIDDAGDPALWAALAEGVSLRGERIHVAGGAIGHRVQQPHRPQVALYAARRVGLLDGATALRLADSHRLSDLRPLAGLAGLRSLDLNGCRGLIDLSPLATLTALETLNLEYCWRVGELSPLAELPALRRLVLRRCGGLTALDGPDWAALDLSEGLDLENCHALTDLSALAAATGLRELSLKGCRALVDLSPLAEVTTLETISLESCERVEDFSPLADLPALTRVDLRGRGHTVDALRPLRPRAGRPTLVMDRQKILPAPAPSAPLDRTQKKELASIRKLLRAGELQEAFAAVASLDDPAIWAVFAEGIHVSDGQLYVGQGEIKKRVDRPLRGQAALYAAAHHGLLDFSEAMQFRWALTDLSPLAGNEAIRSLRLYSVMALRDLRPLAAMSQLQDLHVVGAGVLTDLSSLAGLTELRTLNLTGCRALTDLSPLAGLAGLRELDLTRCVALTDLSPLAGLSELQVRR